MDYAKVRRRVEKELGRSGLARAFRRVADAPPPDLRADLLSLDALCGHEIELETGTPLGSVGGGREVETCA